MGRGGVCGVVTGALMVIGLRFADTNAEDTSSRGETFDKAGEFTRKFAARHGSMECKEILGADLSTKEGLEKAWEENLFRTVCPPFVRSGVEILEELV